VSDVEVLWVQGMSGREEIGSESSSDPPGEEICPVGRQAKAASRD
jgi:hypothetical protein